MIRVGIVGASGYTGAELARLLANHPEVELRVITSETYAGQALNQLYPALQALAQLKFISRHQVDLSPANLDVVFLALPHGESMNMVPALISAGQRVIDLSGDFRFPDVSIYEHWYGQTHTSPDLAREAAYGLTELFREEIRGKKLVANPGCYATVAVLALYPLIQAQCVDSQSLVVDAKSGISGAGRKTTPATAYNVMAENIVPYKIGGLHQHTPEIEYALTHATGQPVKLILSPQMISARRGILCTAYGRQVSTHTSADLLQLYQGAYSQEPFIRVQALDQPWPDLSSAVGSNHCVIKITSDERTHMVVVVAVIDNLIKGASGQAIQNMNLLFGFPETMGLPQAGWIP